MDAAQVTPEDVGAVLEPAIFPAHGAFADGKARSCVLRRQGVAADSPRRSGPDAASADRFAAQNGNSLD